MIHVHSGYPEHETDLLNPDYVMLARSFGARGFRVERPGDLHGVVAEMFAAEGPALLDVRIFPDELTIPPRIAAEKAWGFTKARVKEWMLHEFEGEK